TTPPKPIQWSPIGDHTTMAVLRFMQIRGDVGELSVSEFEYQSKSKPQTDPCFSNTLRTAEGLIFRDSSISISMGNISQSYGTPPKPIPIFKLRTYSFRRSSCYHPLTFCCRLLR